MKHLLVILCFCVLYSCDKEKTYTINTPPPNSSPVIVSDSIRLIFSTHSNVKDSMFGVPYLLFPLPINHDTCIISESNNSSLYNWNFHYDTMVFKGIVSNFFTVWYIFNATGLSMIYAGGNAATLASITTGLNVWGSQRPTLTIYFNDSLVGTYQYQAQAIPHKPGDSTFSLEEVIYIH